MNSNEFFKMSMSDRCQYIQSKIDLEHKTVKELASELGTNNSVIGSHYLSHQHILKTHRNMYGMDPKRNNNRKY